VALFLPVAVGIILVLNLPSVGHTGRYFAIEIALVFNAAVVVTIIAIFGVASSISTMFRVLLDLDIILTDSLASLMWPWKVASSKILPGD